LDEEENGRKTMRAIRKVVEYQKKIREKGERGTILFADLTGSTAYKLLKPLEDAQVKIYVHNDIATQGVQVHEGKVIKYLGDGVMAIFQGEESDINAIDAAITIQNAFKDYNKERGLKDLDKIQSKIGINSGDVFLWDYVPEGDPQGTTVDIASRITDLAKPDQILCSATCKEKCSGKTDVRFGDTVNRELKGITEKIGICEVIWLNELKIKETIHISPPIDRIKSLLQSATKAEEQGEYFSAIDWYKEILNEDSLHFIANLKLGIIIYKHQKELTQRYNLEQHKLNQYKLEDALEFVKKAKESNPGSAEAKLLYTTLLWVINERSPSDEMLEDLIKETRSAKDIFHEKLNWHMELEAANNLAYFYGELYERKKEKIQLDEAIKLCEHVDEEFKRIRSDQYAGFLDTYAFLLMKRKNSKDLKKAHEVLKIAEEIGDSQYIQYIYGHLEELHRKASELGISLNQVPLRLSTTVDSFTQI
jgi:class 3 adenylate cyclase